MFVTVILFGPESGVVIVFLECLVISLWNNLRGSAIHKILFNTAAPSIAIWTAAHVFFRISGFEPYATLPQAAARHSLQELFTPLAVFTAVYFLLNSGLITIVVGLEKNHSPVELWRRNFVWLSVNYFSGASVAAIIVTFSGEVKSAHSPLLCRYWLCATSHSGQPSTGLVTAIGI